MDVTKDYYDPWPVSANDPSRIVGEFEFKCEIQTQTYGKHNELAYKYRYLKHTDESEKEDLLRRMRHSQPWNVTRKKEALKSLNEWKVEASSCFNRDGTMPSEEQLSKDRKKYVKVYRCIREVYETLNEALKTPYEVYTDPFDEDRKVWLKARKEARKKEKEEFERKGITPEEVKAAIDKEKFDKKRLRRTQFLIEAIPQFKDLGNAINKLLSEMQGDYSQEAVEEFRRAYDVFNGSRGFSGSRPFGQLKKYAKKDEGK